MPPTPLSPKHPPAQKGIMYAQSCNTEHFFPLQYGLLQGSIETSGRTRMRCIKTHAKVRSDQMQKMTSLTPSIHEVVHLKVFFKIFRF